MVECTSPRCLGLVNRLKTGDDNSDDKIVITDDYYRKVTIMKVVVMMMIICRDRYIHQSNRIILMLAGMEQKCKITLIEKGG